MLGDNRAVKRFEWDIWPKPSPVIASGSEAIQTRAVEASV
jgi:hypothetical protein